MAKILVTGADGFIGSHLVEELVRSGRDVRAFVLYNSFGQWGWLDTVPEDVRASLDVVMGDVRDANGVRTAMKGCDGALHLAALIGIPYSYHAAESYVDVNIRGTLNVVQAARELGLSKVVVTSTSEVYGTAQFVPITEDHPLVGQSPYAATKIGADQIAMSYFRSFGTPVAIARPFNTYGPRQSSRAVIPTVITQLANGSNRLKLGALSPTRDFNFVADTVRGIIAVHDSAAATGEVTNIGSNFEISVGDTVALIAEVMDKDFSIECEEERVRPALSEVERLCADNGKARRLLGWQPRIRRPRRAPARIEDHRGLVLRSREPGALSRRSLHDLSVQRESGTDRPRPHGAPASASFARAWSRRGGRVRHAGAGTREGARGLRPCSGGTVCGRRGDDREAQAGVGGGGDHGAVACRARLRGCVRRSPRDPVREADGGVARAMRRHDCSLQGGQHAARGQSSDAVHGAVHGAEGDRAGRSPSADWRA